MAPRSRRKREIAADNLLSYCSHGEQNSSGKLTCECGEMKRPSYEWRWNKEKSSESTRISEDKLQVDLISGQCTRVTETLVVGDKVMGRDDHEFWEVKLTGQQTVNPASLCVGLASRSYIQSKLKSSNRCTRSKVNNEKYCISNLGHLIQPQQMVVGSQFVTHGSGQKAVFTRGSLVGVYLDNTRGVVQFCVNRVKQAEMRLNDYERKELFPIVTSTQPGSGVKLMYSVSYPDTLEFKCARLISQVCNKELSPVIPEHIQALLIKNFSVLFPPRNWTDLYIAHEALEDSFLNTQKESHAEKVEIHANSESKSNLPRVHDLKRNRDTKNKRKGKNEEQPNTGKENMNLTTQKRKYSKSNNQKPTKPRSARENVTTKRCAKVEMRSRKRTRRSELMDVQSDSEYLTSDDEYVFIMSRPLEEKTGINKVSYRKAF